MRLLSRLSRPHALALDRLVPDGAPLVALLGNGRYWEIATAFSEITLEEARELPLATEETVLGVLSYDDLCPFARQPRARSRLFRVHERLVFDHEALEVWLVGARGTGSAIHLEVPSTAGLREAESRDDGAGTAGSAAPLALVPATTDEAYEDLVRRALADIRDGRYYQINLLRYFTAAAAPTRAWLLARLAAFAGPFGALVDVPGLTLASFSPERFVSAHHDRAETFPVKGTAPRDSDPVRDRANADQLRASAKDRAELAMIVDLMRNDLGRVARRGTVAVPEPLRLDSHANVHHLSARVTAALPAGLRLGTLLDAVCPGGSITGAPKREVMQAIRAYEERDRGYFMGHAIRLDPARGFDSSILIRTLARVGGPQNAYEFAAGSGIVVASDPARERDEIAAKSRVLTAAAPLPRPKDLTPGINP